MDPEPDPDLEPEPEPDLVATDHLLNPAPEELKSDRSLATVMSLSR